MERDHRARARCEDRIRCAKQTGLEPLPFSDFEMNAVWLELVGQAGCPPISAGYGLRSETAAASAARRACWSTRADLSAHTRRATVELTGQNGKRHNTATRVKTSCKGPKKHRARRRR